MEMGTNTNISFAFSIKYVSILENIKLVNAKVTVTIF
jgi:hypothetical protein